MNKAEQPQKQSGTSPMQEEHAREKNTASILESAEGLGYQRVESFDALELTDQQKGLIQSKSIIMDRVKEPATCFLRGIREDGAEVKAFFLGSTGSYHSGYIFTPTSSAGFYFGTDFAIQNITNLLKLSLEQPSQEQHE